MTVLLETRRVGKSFGPFRALDGVSMTASAGEVLAIVGPNGAAKTTLVNLLTGLLQPTDGEVFFQGKTIAGQGPVLLAELGLARAFQLIQIFPRLTVRESLAIAVISRRQRRWSLLSAVASDKQALVASQSNLEGWRRGSIHSPPIFLRARRSCSTSPRRSRSIQR